MSTPASHGLVSRLVLARLCPAAIGTLCLVAVACGDDKNGSGGTSDPTPSAGTGGTPAAAGTAGTAPVGTAGTGSNIGGTSAAGSASGGTGGNVATGGSGAAGGGAGGTGGVGGGGGAGGNGGAAAGGTGVAGGAPFEGTAQRPQIPAASSGDFTVLKYFEKYGTVGAPLVDNWDPTAGVGDVSTLTPKYKVAASGGTDTTIQAAIDKAVAAGGTERVAIEIADGTYREVVCVPSGAPPITLYSKNPDASATRIVFDNYAGKTKDAQTPANPCNPALGSTTYGTSGSTTFSAYGKAFYAKNLTFENDTDEAAAGAAASVQAVALTAQGDKQIYENVRLLGNQDTFFVKSAGVDQIARVYVTKSFIQGDTDFVFGRGTLVVDQSEIHFISTRQGSKGYAIVPSTDSRNPYGILIYKSQFTADAGTAAHQVYLGRAWDESGKDLATYSMLVASGIYPNGQAVIRESTLGAHVRTADPWAEAATTKRPFSAMAGMYPANRLYELGNTGPGAATP